MAALVDGFMDTGITATHTLIMTLELKTQLGAWTSDDAWVHGLYFRVKASSGATNLGNPNCSSWSSMDLEYSTTAGGPYTVLSTGAGSAAGDPPWLPAATIERTVGPLRLGCRVEGASSAEPGVLVYRWFKDAATTTVLKLNTATITTTTHTDPPTQGHDAIRFAYYNASNLGDPSLNFTSTYDHTRFDGFFANGSAVTEPTPYVYKFQVGPGTGGWNGATFHPPYKWTMNLACDDTAGSAVAADATQDGARVCPASYTREEVLFPSYTATGFPDSVTTAPGGHLPAAAVLANPWLAAQTIAPQQQTFEFVGHAPETPGSASPVSWTVGTITVAASRNVLASANAWSTVTGTVAIGGTATVPTFTVSAGPATVSRDLLSHWRRWNDSFDALYQPLDQLRATKADFYAPPATPDIWGWGTYGLLDVDMTIPAGSDVTLTLLVNWAIPKTSFATDTFETSYTLTFPAGSRTTQRVDLLFPNETTSRPYYGERVDRVRIAGLPVNAGAYTLHALTLVGAEQPYLRVGGRTVYHRGAGTAPSYGGMVLACDGSAPGLLYGDAASPTPIADQNGDGWTDSYGDHQNGRFEKSGGSQSTFGYAPGMRAADLTGSFDEFNRLEGVTATINLATITAALTDTFGVDLQFRLSAGSFVDCPYLPSWLVPVWPHVRLTYGAATNLAARTLFTAITVPEGRAAADHVLFGRNTLGAVVDAVVTNASIARQGAGAVVVLKCYTPAAGAPDPSDPTLGSATTDLSGFVTISHPTGTLAGSEIILYPTE